MIFTKEEYRELGYEGVLPSADRSNVSGEGNHLRDHDAIARVLWGPGVGGSAGKQTMIKITKNEDSFSFDGPQIADILAIGSEDLVPTLDTYKMYSELYDVIVSQPGLMDLPYTEWPVGAWYELFYDGVVGIVLRAQPFFQTSLSGHVKAAVENINLEGIWGLFKHALEVQEHVYTSGQFEPPLPEQTDDTNVFSGNTFYYPGPYGSFEEGRVLISVRPKYTDTIKDLTARLEALENPA